MDSGPLHMDILIMLLQSQPEWFRGEDKLGRGPTILWAPGGAMANNGGLWLELEHITLVPPGTYACLYPSYL